MGKGCAINENEVIEKIRSGQSDLYGDLVRQYQKRVAGRCFSILQNHAEAEEAAQDIFVKSYRFLGKFKGDSSFSTWLYRITTNHCLDVLRKRNRRRTISLSALIEEGGNSVQRFFSTSAVAASRVENNDLVEKILSGIPEEYRAILILREGEGMPYTEIAEELKCSINVVKGRLARARMQAHKNLLDFIQNQDINLFDLEEKNKSCHRPIKIPEAIPQPF